MTEQDISKDIISAAIEVHKQLGGPGLMESIYKGALEMELQNLGHRVEREVLVPVIYKGVQIHDPLRIDMLIDSVVVVEAKATNKMLPVYSVQCNTYLRLTGKKLGLVLNFGMQRLVDGIDRVINPQAFSPEDLEQSKLEHPSVRFRPIG